MRSRPFRILFLIFLCLWFGIIVPGHERGQIVLPGSAPVAAAGSCCAMRGGILANQDYDCDPDRKNKPSRQDQKRCAMCQLIATLQVADPPLLLLAPMGLLAILPPQRSLGIAHLPYLGPTQGRAPPVV